MKRIPAPVLVGRRQQGKSQSSFLVLRERERDEHNERGYGTWTVPIKNGQPALFRCTELDGLRMSSFKNDALPEMVGTDIRWPLIVKSTPLSRADQNSVFMRLLRAPLVDRAG